MRISRAKYGFSISKLFVAEIRTYVIDQEPSHYINAMCDYYGGSSELPKTDDFGWAQTRLLTVDNEAKAKYYKEQFPRNDNSFEFQKNQLFSKRKYVFRRVRTATIINMIQTNNIGTSDRYRTQNEHYETLDIHGNTILIPYHVLNAISKFHSNGQIKI